MRSVFERTEKKYLLSYEQYQEILAEVKSHMEDDEYPRYTICSLYFDTDSFDLIRTSLEKPIYKEKLRIRSYGVPKLGDIVFLEMKKKYKGVVYKRRVALPYERAMKILESGVAGTDSQIMSEIQYFLDHYSPTPKVFIAYDREAYKGEDELRVTFDTNLRARETELDLRKGDYGHLILDSSLVLMEVKASLALPLWLVHAMSEQHVYPSSFSKYGHEYTNNILGEKKQCLEAY